MTILHELRHISSAIDYLNRKRSELLDDLKESLEKYGFPYKIGQKLEGYDGLIYKVEAINTLIYQGVDGPCAYYQVQAASTIIPHYQKDYIVEVK